MTTRALPWVAAAALAALVPWVAGLSGLAYVPFWALACAPGVPVGLALAGRHPFGWVAGVAIGYTTSCLTIWALVVTG